MNRSHIVMFAATVLAGCSSSSSSDSGPCTASGTYLVHYALKSGNCSTPPDQLVALPSDAGASGCTTDETKSDDACKVDATTTCPDRTIVSTFSSGNGGASYSGTATFTVTGSDACVATYAVTETRQ